MSQLRFRISRWAPAYGCPEEPDASAFRLISPTLILDVTKHYRLKIRNETRSVDAYVRFVDTYNRALFHVK